MTKTSFPYRVENNNITVDRNGTELIGMPAWWYLRNLNRHDWLHDRDGFEFRREEDAIWFKMVWDNV
jgi:hypothetical protein